MSCRPRSTPVEARFDQHRRQARALTSAGRSRAGPSTAGSAPEPATSSRRPAASSARPAATPSTGGQPQPVDAEAAGPRAVARPEPAGDRGRGAVGQEDEQADGVARTARGHAESGQRHGARGARRRPSRRAGRAARRPARRTPVRRARGSRRSRVAPYGPWHRARPTLLDSIGEVLSSTPGGEGSASDADGQLSTATARFALSTGRDRDGLAHGSTGYLIQAVHTPYPGLWTTFTHRSSRVVVHRSRTGVTGAGSWPAAEARSYVATRPGSRTSPRVRLCR